MMHSLFQSVVLACVGVLLAWLLRRPLRRLAGPCPAFCVWALPCLLAIVPWLPTMILTPMSAFSPPTLPALWVAPTTPAQTAAAPVSPWLCLWLGGCGLMLLRLAICYLRVMRTSRPLTMSMRRALASDVARRNVRRLRLHPAGPAVLFGTPCHVLLPADFTDRFDAEARTQVLAHEFAHLRRGDPLWSLLAELVLAALWFFPPAWLAMSCFHLDQELACDAAVLRREPSAIARYARTLIGSNTTAEALPAMNPWLSKPQLKERLIMIQQYRISRLRQTVGYVGLVLLLAGAAFAAQAALPGVAGATRQATSTTSPQADQPSVDMAFKQRYPPRYPKEAIENKQEGTVVLKILVQPDGHPSKTEVAQSSGYGSLDQAAIDAAMNWRFHPRMVNGKPAKGWAKVPVTFSLDENAPAGDSTAHTEHWPHFPKKAMQQRHEGTVVLLIHVDANGKPSEAKIEKSSGYASLDKAAARGAMHWTLAPPTSNGKPHAGWVRRHVTFRLDHEKAARREKTIRTSS